MKIDFLAQAQAIGLVSIFISSNRPLSTYHYAALVLSSTAF